MKRMKTSRKAGFTLVEIVVVLVVLAILAAIAVPAISGYQQKNREREAQTACMSAVAWANTLASELYARGEVDGVSKSEVLGKAVRSADFLTRVLERAGLDGRIAVLTVSADAQVVELRYFLAGDRAEYWYGATNSYRPVQALQHLQAAIAAVAEESWNKANSYTDSGAVGYNASTGSAALQGRSDKIHNYMVEQGVNLTNCMWTLQNNGNGVDDYWLYYLPMEEGVEYREGDKVTVYVYRTKDQGYYTAKAELKKNNYGYLVLRLLGSRNDWVAYEES